MYLQSGNIFNIKSLTFKIKTTDSWSEKKTDYVVTTTAIMDVKYSIASEQ